MDGITATGLTKTYGRNTVLRDVGFGCPPGEITAFLGPNGAGKTTVLRIAAGLSRPDSGEVRFGGGRLRDAPFPGRLAGFSLDASAFHPGRSAGETLRLAAIACGASKGEAVAMLDRVGLGPVGRRRVGKLSLGMRQRLAVGCALIGTPQHLVLDEPVNGLDVEGVLWVRRTLQDHAKAGGTVLLSSHLLREVQTMADKVVLLDRGRVVADARPEDLVPDPGSTAATPEPDALEALLVRHAIAYERDGEQFTAACSPEQLGRLTAQERLPLARLGSSGGGDLEQAFLRLTQGEFTGQGADRA